MFIRPARQTLRLLPLLILGVTLIGGCTARRETRPVLTDVPYESGPWRYQGSSGRVIKTAHYELHTTLNDDVLLDALPQAVETAYSFYRELVPTAGEPAERMKIYLFARRGEWSHFTRDFAGPRARILLKIRNGGYMERGVSVVEYVAHSVTFPLLTHEGFHQYLHHCVDSRVPAWLNEGLAVACEGQRWGRDGLIEFDPWHNPTRRNTLAQALLRDKLFPLDKLLCINAGHVVGGTASEVGAYYAQLWALTLFLREGADGKYADGFARLLSTLGTEDLELYARAAHVKSSHKRYNYGRALFCNFISDDIETVEREYREFMRERVLGARSNRK